MKSMLIYLALVTVACWLLFTSCSSGGGNSNNANVAISANSPSPSTSTNINSAKSGGEISNNAPLNTNISPTDNVESLPKEELSKLRSERHDFIGGNNFGVEDEIYNGTNWKLKEVTVHVRVLSPNDSVLFDENVPLPLHPNSSGEPLKKSLFYRANIFPRELEMKGRTQNMGIVSARGTKAFVKQ